MKNHRISLIAAIGERTRALGQNGDLLFKIPEDLKHFRDRTRGHPVIMGRKTWESLPSASQPLPGRLNFVVTRNASYKAAGATVCASLSEALEKTEGAEGAEEIFVIGGGELYAEALPHADLLYLTLVDNDALGDTFFPPYPNFTEVLEEQGPFEYAGLRYRFITLRCPQA